MSYFDGIFKPHRSGYCDSLPQKPIDSCMVFDVSKGGRLVASRMSEGIMPPASLKEFISADELDFLVEYLGSYAERPAIVSTSLGFAVVIAALYPSTSLCVLSIPSIGGENFLRVAKNQKWDIALSPVAVKRQLRRTGIHEGHIQSSRNLCGVLSKCFTPRLISDESARGEELRERTIAIVEYVSRRSRIILEESVVISNEFDLPLFTAFVLLFTLSGRASRADECAKISLQAHDYGIEAVIVEKSGRDRARIQKTVAEICARGNIPFECFCEDGRVFSRIVPLRRDWAYLGIKSPEDN